MSGIHPTAIVEPGAQLGEGVVIGANAFVGPHVRLGDGVELRPMAYLSGHTEVGPETAIFSFASVGEIPQDIKYRGEATRLVIGARNTIREHVTIHPGTEDAGGLTTVGDDNLIMVGSHIAHDCQVGNGAILSNAVLLAGHVRVEDHAGTPSNPSEAPFAGSPACCRSSRTSPSSWWCSRRYGAAS